MGRLGLKHFDFSVKYKSNPVGSFFEYGDKIESGEIVVNLNSGNGGSIYRHWTSLREGGYTGKRDNL
jgi:hypothetical protein